MINLRLKSSKENILKTDRNDKQPHNNFQLNLKPKRYEFVSLTSKELQGITREALKPCSSFNC